MLTLDVSETLHTSIAFLELSSGLWCNESLHIKRALLVERGDLGVFGRFSGGGWWGVRGAAFRSTCARISVWDTSRCRQVLLGCDGALRSDGGAHR